MNGRYFSVKAHHLSLRLYVPHILRLKSYNATIQMRHYKEYCGAEKKNGSIFCVYRYILIKEKSIKPNEAIWQFFPLYCCLVTLRAVGYYFLLVHPEKRLKRKAKEIGDVCTQATGYHAVFLAFTGCEWSRFQKNPAI